MLTLYGSKGSGSAAIEAALTLLDAPWRQVDAARWNPSAGFDELVREVNPLGQIPTLRLDDGSVLTESAACLIHLGLVHPESGLLPRDASRRARSMRGLVYLTANCYAAIGIVDYPERWVASDDAAVHRAVGAGARRRLHALWDIFDDQFPATPWLAGEALGALDLLAAVVSRWSGARAHLAESRPAFRALLDRIDADPRIAAVFARHWPPSG